MKEHFYGKANRCELHAWDFCSGVSDSQSVANFVMIPHWNKVVNSNTGSISGKVCVGSLIYTEDSLHPAPHALEPVFRLEPFVLRTVKCAM
mmetsp:Transcript_30410/g.46403  ORF Transcript_30410/g.46403 Transcript_30410/m.46403 type:complete len:91 (-) Transcript_30410:89-361(-)